MTSMKFIFLIVPAVLIAIALGVYLRRKKSAPDEFDNRPMSGGDFGSGVKAARDDSLIMTVLAWAAAIGIIAAIALILVGNLLPQRETNSGGPELYPQKESSSTGDSSETGADTATPTFSAQDLFPAYLSQPLPKDKEPWNFPPPAVSRQPVIFSAPMLKFMPLSVTIDSAHSQRTFFIRNDGNANLTYSLSTNDKRISVSPTSGAIPPKELVWITVTAATDGIVIIDTNGGHDVEQVFYKP